MSRSFNADFITEKNKISDGPGPYNIIEFGFATPTIFSDRVVDLGVDFDVDFVGQGETSRDWLGISVNPSTGDVWACTASIGDDNDIYKNTWESTKTSLIM